MGLVPQLTVILFCLLACASAVVRGCNHHTLQEIIQHLNTLSREKSPCAELLVTDVFADPQNCPVSELRQTTLKDFLENLKRIMQKRYSKCRR
uniref:Interleukin-4 n=1 Tax=Cavia porcellus TaxID=10141 RepID=V9NJM6_CAVPO|nr:IL-4 delta 3 [Cavia porcellus]